MLKVQKFLLSRKLDDLRFDPFNLQISLKDNLVLLKYNQFNSDFSNGIVKECRGLILEKDTWKVICHPFHKFFNLGESQAFNSINLDESVLWEKADGSIIKIFFYNGIWNVATNGTIDADDALSRDGISFKELFFDIISEDDFYNLAENFNKGVTYLFEMIHPSTQIVVDYENTKELVFTGMINNESDEDGNMVDYDILSICKKMEKIFKNYPIRYPKTFNFSLNDIKELSDIADNENNSGNEFEGFVVSQIYDGNVIGRVKIKSPKYVHLHHIATGESVTNNLIEVIKKNETEEFEIYLNKLPEHVSEEYKALKKKYFNLIEYLSVEGEKYRNKSKNVTRKELALEIQKFIERKYNGFIFTMVDNLEITPTELLQNYGTKKMKLLLG